jgi:hypothetical protein
MKRLIFLVATLLVTMTAWGSMRFLNSSDVQLGNFYKMKCGNGLSCTASGGSLLITPNGANQAFTIGEGDAEDTQVTFDGNAQDFYIGLDDGTDDLLVGVGSAVGTTPALSVDENTDVTFSGNIIGTAAVGFGAVATFTDSDATPDVSDGSYFNTNTSSVTITDFDGAGIYEGQILVVTSKGAITYDVTASGIKGGTTDIVTAAGDVTTFIYDGTDWLVVARMDMSDDLN